MKNSHIQLPKGHMKPFSYEKTIECVYTLDVKTNAIHESDIKYLDTEMGFYSDDVETAMNDQYESKFFSIRSRLVDLFNNKIKHYHFDEDERKVIINYINLSILRSKKSLDIVNEESIWAQITGGFSNNDLVLTRLNGILKSNMLEEMVIRIIKNNSDTKFVLPSCSFYYTDHLFESFIIAEYLVVMPVTPDIAFLLIPQTNNEEFLSSFKGYIILDESKDIKYLNEQALITEIETDKKFIVSKTKKELKILSKSLQGFLD
jgi:hypothetical protein